MKTIEILLIIRQNLIRFYKKYDHIIFLLLKFILIFSTIRMLGLSVGYQGMLGGAMSILFLALIGTFLPEKWLILETIILVPLYIMNTNLVLAGVIFVFLMVLYLLFMRLFPKESLLIIATVVAFNIGMEVVIPVIVALFGSYICIIPIIIGTFIYFVAPEMVGMLQSNGAGKDEVLEVFTNIVNVQFKDLMSNPIMLCTIVVFFIVFSIVYIIRKQSIDFAPYVAIGVGAVMNLVGFGLGILFLDVDINMLSVVMMTIFCVVVAVIAQFFSKVLDYASAEVVSFEDEENYYHVKIIPKIYLSTSHKKVKRVYNNKVDGLEHISRIMNTKDEGTGI